MPGVCKTDESEPVANPLQHFYLRRSNERQILKLLLPDLSYLNAQAAAQNIKTGGGHPLKFAAPDQDADYEHRAFHTGIVTTRPDNWHDAFNALVWLSFPLSKAALNASHLAARDAHAGKKNQRGKVRDTLTQFDECGVIVVGTSVALWNTLCLHQWSEVFVAQRASLLATTRFIVFGHGSLDALRAPFVGLCGKAIFIHAEPSWLAAIDAGDVARVDAALAQRISSTNWQTTLQGLGNLQPLPLQGIPGATAENEHAEYYQNPRQFRPRRQRDSATCEAHQ